MVIVPKDQLIKQKCARVNWNKLILILITPEWLK